MSQDTRAQWQWLVDTYWYVTLPDLPALQLDPSTNTLNWMVDQTVWHITGYKTGYFWGVTATLCYEQGSTLPTLGPLSQPGHYTMLGTVFPSGQVQITFQATGRNSDAAPTIGYGNLIQVGEAWAFEMQMSTEPRGNRLLHWARMMQTREGEPSFENLPGVELSVPEMLEDASYPEFEQSAD